MSMNFSKNTNFCAGRKIPRFGCRNRGCRWNPKIFIFDSFCAPGADARRNRQPPKSVLTVVLSES